MSKLNVIKKPKIMVIGHARHGKDEVGELLTKLLGLQYISSSLICMEEFCFDAMKEEFGYETIEECYADRDNHRTLLHWLIRIYNWHDKAAVSKLILQERNMDMYLGIREIRELQESKRQGVHDVVVWVDALSRKPKESKSSFNISITEADYIIDNNGPVEALEGEVLKFIAWLEEKGHLICAP